MSADLQARLAAQAAAPVNDGDSRIRELERETQTLQEELDSMGMRLRRAYADAEDARAQLLAMPPSPLAVMESGGAASADGLEEIHKLRLELGRAVERAKAAEARVSALESGRSSAEEDPGEGAPADGDDDKSLRFRLAKTAARKKSGDVGSGGAGSMWS